MSINSINNNQEKFDTNQSTFSTEQFLLGNYDPKENKKNILYSKGKESLQYNCYLRCFKWEYDNDDKIPFIEEKFELIEKNLNKNKRKDLIKDIKLINLDEIFDENSEVIENEYNIGTLNSLNNSNEDISYLRPAGDETKISDRTSSNQYIFKYRKIKKDRNSFYRALIFYFLEYIILNKNIILMKEFLTLFNEKISENNPKIQNKQYIMENIKKIDKETIIEILDIIIRAMEKSKIDGIYNMDDELSDYKILLKVFLKSEAFNYGLIFFTRYLIYEYISENEKKHLSKEINVEIGQLLPVKYILDNDGNLHFLFEDYYKELMNMDETNESIDNFIIPYIFKCNLNIVKYNYKNGENQIKKNSYKCGKTIDLEINLLTRDDRYDIYYEKYYYDKHCRLLNIIIKENNNSKNSGNNNKSQRNYTKHNTMQENNTDNSKILQLSKTGSSISTFTMNVNKTNIKNMIYNGLAKCLKCENNYNHRENVFGLCKTCLKMELKNRILSAYLEFLQKGYTKNCEEKLNNFISKLKVNISMQNNIYLNTAIHNSGFQFKELFFEIRQNMCLYCGACMENNDYILNLPCGCKICKKKCLENYMKKIEETNKSVLMDEKDDFICIIPMSECPCGFKYDINSFVEIIDIMRKKGEKEYKKIYEETVKNNWKWKCMICLENFHKNKNYFRLILSDDKIDQRLLNKFELKHLICKTCAINKNIENVNKIFCKFCKSKHIIVFIKKVNSDNKTESACIII